jgi:hypothetical protein
MPLGARVETYAPRAEYAPRPANLLHPEYFPLKMETDVGGASRWNTLRAFRVLRWSNNSTR